MPAIGNIVVNDAETTPVAHTFAPVTTDGGLAKLANRSAITPQGFETLVTEVKLPTNPNGAHRLRLAMGDPTEVTVSGQTVIDHVNSFEVTLNFSQKSTAQGRKNLLKMLSNLASHATIVAMAENLEPQY